jgi:hypothetical protein
MNNILPKTPSYISGYWKPWKNDSNFLDSYTEYIKDVSLTKYSADTIGQYINQASTEQINSINSIGNKLGIGLNILSNHLNDVSNKLDDISNQLSISNYLLVSINKNSDLIVEQNILTNILLNDVNQLLNIPDIEKERKLYIELGIKFFINAKNNQELFEDALENFIKAEKLMHQDYFVLHRIGLIYLYVEKYLDVEKALTYFIKSAKYSSVETKSNIYKISNAFYNDKDKTNKLDKELQFYEDNFNFNDFPFLSNSEYNGFYIEKYSYNIYTVNNTIDDGYDCANSDKIFLSDLIDNVSISNNLKSEFKTIIKDINEIINKNGFINNNLNSINLIASDSYEKAAFCSYVIGDFSNSVEYQKQAILFNNNINNKFFLVKYQIRNNDIEEGINLLSELIDENPEIVLGIFKEIDLFNSTEVLNLLDKKNEEINNKLEILIKKINSHESTEIKRYKNQLLEVIGKEFHLKSLLEKKVEYFLGLLDINKNNFVSEVNSFINYLNTVTLCTINKKSIVEELNSIIKFELEEAINILKKIKNVVKDDELKIGSKYQGGIVFFIDDINKKGLIVSENDIGKAFWGGEGIIGTKRELWTGEENTNKIIDNASWYVEKSWFKTNYSPASTAARICKELNLNGFNDWYLPSICELELLYENSKTINSLNFSNNFYWSSSEYGLKDRNYDGEEELDHNHSFRLEYAEQINLVTGETYSSYFKERNQIKLVRAARIFYF